MRLFLALLLVIGCSATSFGDIQDPPSNDQGPTRKLGRGLANMIFGSTEIPVTMAQINERKGNSAAAGYGVIRGTGRAFARFAAGLYEVLLWPFPVHRGTYQPILPSDIPWVRRGYSEFPPEPGNESKYPYVRTY